MGKGLTPPARAPQSGGTGSRHTSVDELKAQEVQGEEHDDGVPVLLPSDGPWNGGSDVSSDLTLSPQPQKGTCCTDCTGPASGIHYASTGPEKPHLPGLRTSLSDLEAGCRATSPPLGSCSRGRLEDV